MTCSKGKSWQAQEDTTEGSSPNGPLLLLGSLQAYLPPTLNLDGFSLSLFLPRTVPSLSLSQAIPHTWVTQISGLSDMWDHPPTLHHQCARILVQQWLVSNRREAPYAVMTCLPHLTLLSPDMPKHSTGVIPLQRISTTAFINVLYPPLQGMFVYIYMHSYTQHGKGSVFLFFVIKVNVCTGKI